MPVENVDPVHQLRSRRFTIRKYFNNSSSLSLFNRIKIHSQLSRYFTARGSCAGFSLVSPVRYTSTTQSMIGLHFPKVALVGNAIPPIFRSDF